jgi:hypothetical protein
VAKRRRTGTPGSLTALSRNMVMRHPVLHPRSMCKIGWRLSKHDEKSRKNENAGRRSRRRAERNDSNSGLVSFKYQFPNHCSISAPYPYASSVALDESLIVLDTPRLRIGNLVSATAPHSRPSYTHRFANDSLSLAIFRGDRIACRPRGPPIL